jgi:O-antigen/teichoic acid export membrane protein
MDKSRGRALLKSTAAILVLSNLGNFVNYLIQIVLGRYLSAEDYGIFNAVIGLGVILGSASQILPIVLSKFIAQLESRHLSCSELIDTWHQRVVRWGALFILILLGLAPFLSSYLQIPSSMPLLIFLANIYFYHLLALYTGVLYGFGEYLIANALGLAHTLIRLLLTWIAVSQFHYSYNAALLIWGGANIVIWLWKMSAVRGILEKKSALATLGKTDDPPKSLQTMSFLLPTTLTWIAISIMTNIDMIFVKHVSSPEIAGYYAAAAVVSRISFFLPQALSSIILPEVSRGVTNKHVVVLGGVAIGLVIATGFAGLSWYFPSEIMGALFGHAKEASTSYLPMISLAMALASIINLLASGMLAMEIYKFLYPTYIFLFAACAYISTQPSISPVTIAGTLAAAFAMILVAMIVMYWRGALATLKTKAA